MFISENYAEIKARNPKVRIGIKPVRTKCGHHSIFMSENYAEIKACNPEANPQAMLRKLSSAWKNLDPETKAKHKNRGHAARLGSADSPDTKGQ